VFKNINIKFVLSMIAMFSIFTLLILLILLEKKEEKALKVDINYEVISTEFTNRKVITLFCEKLTQNVLVEFSNKNNNLENNIFYMIDNKTNVKCSKIKTSIK